MIQSLHEQLLQALEDCRLVFKDWPIMRKKMTEIISEMDYAPSALSSDKLHETKAFLH